MDLQDTTQGLTISQGGQMRRHVVAKGPRDTVKSSVPAMRASHNTGNISSDFETIDNQPVKILSTQLEFVGERLWVLFTNTKSGFQRERGRGQTGDVNKTIQIEHEMNKTLSTGQVQIWMNHAISYLWGDVCGISLQFPEKDMC